MKIKAYVLASFVDWLETSVRSYYDSVDQIIVTWDENHLSYSGRPLEIPKCLEILQAIDIHKKMTWNPGHYARLNHKPIDNETYQRQCAIDLAGDADWILQIDTDEVVTDVETLLSCLQEATDKKFLCVDFPARFLFRQLSEHRYMEVCSRFWGPVANYPGALAVRPGTLLEHARQSPEKPFRVDFKSVNTDPWRSRNTPVHRVIKPDQAILHFAWIRDEAAMLEKSQVSNHSKDANWERELKRWFRSHKHPYLTALQTPFLRTETGCYPRGISNHLRTTTIKLPQHLPLDASVRTTNEH